MFRVPSTLVNTAVIAAVSALCADTYSGWFGTASSGFQPGCSTVAGLPSLNPGTGPKPSDCTELGSMAGVGRQNREWYFVDITEMPLSAAITLTIAIRGALSKVPSPRLSAI